MEIDIFGSRKREYRDLSLAFTMNPVTNDVVAVTGADAVKRSIRTLLLTNAGEVPFMPTFGSHLTHLLFEPIDAITTALIASEIRACISAYEPRARIMSLGVVPATDELSYEVNITIALVNLTEPITLTLFLTRLR